MYAKVVRYTSSHAAAEVTAGLERVQSGLDQLDEKKERGPRPEAVEAPQGVQVRAALALSTLEGRAEACKLHCTYKFVKV